MKNTALYSCALSVTATSVKLKYMEFGSYEEDGEELNEYTPVFLLHGLLGQKRNFASLGNDLSKILQKKRKIYALDLRNHGEIKINDLINKV